MADTIKLLILILMLPSCSCFKVYKIDRIKNVSHRLKTDGFYVADNNLSNNILIQVILYRDGSFYYAGSDKQDLFDNFEKTDSLLQEWGGYLFNGIYQIKGNKIIMERNIETNFFFASKTKTTKHGKILSDTSFVADIYGDNLDTFYFHPHPYKPDSTLFTCLPELSK